MFVYFQGTKACSHMFLRNGFKCLATFLLGVNNGAQQVGPLLSLHYNVRLEISPTLLYQ